MKYKTVIGLEVHVQLLSKTKIFCSCSTAFGKEPNSQTCPSCLGLPGSLPVFNMEVLALSLKAALVLHCRIQKVMRFDRKNYFYPDLPKAYQISQYDMPLAQNGYLEITDDDRLKRIGITRVHLEEDAGKLIHTGAESLVDFNRCGTPLIEIVSEPDINSPDEAYQYLTKLKSILTYLEVSDCNMQEGSLRCDANISLCPVDSAELGAKAEVKNLNSFKAVRDALKYEAGRQKRLLEEGGRVTQETRLWEENKKVTLSMRSKEEAHDYRYFPEPDLPIFEINEEDIETAKRSLPELADERKSRFVEQYSLSDYDAGILTSAKPLADYYEKCLVILAEPKEVANWLAGAVMAELNARNENFSSIKLKPEELVEMIKLVRDGKINSKAAKEVVLPEIIEGGKKTSDILKEKNISQVSDEGEIGKIADEVIRRNEKSVNDFKEGKKNAIMYLVGQVMKGSKGRANPKTVKEILEKRLSE
ncbi:MAG: Asp-tRNA(Asn)/Glu-tRNA(Gln) amidotransferase subunit GatB [Candidatus Omnitrophica bacterium]|nr:Asp-tRNA(Asn)/Glu-tRNA(Gln) amidotransferase subunit GatB [Candidatus Omnitrophota bacterium]